MKWIKFPDLFGQEYRDALNNALERSEIDAVNVPWDVAEAEISSTGDSSDTLYFVESDTGTFFMVFNPGVAPFDDRHFRRAIVAASDVAALEPDPGLESASAISPPGISHRDAEITAIGFDPSLAQSEWAQSRYNGEVSEVIYQTFITDFFEEEIAAFAENWRELLGIDARVEVIDFDAWEDALALGEIGMTTISLGAANPDPHAIFGIFETVWGEDADSHAYLETLRLLDAAASELDRAERIRAYQELEQYILDEALAMPLLWFNDGYYIRTQPWVHDYMPSKWAVSQFNDVWFDETAPERELPAQ